MDTAMDRGEEPSGADDTRRRGHVSCKSFAPRLRFQLPTTWLPWPWDRATPVTASRAEAVSTELPPAGGVGAAHAGAPPDSRGRGPLCAGRRDGPDSAPCDHAENVAPPPRTQLVSVRPRAAPRAPGSPTRPWGASTQASAAVPPRDIPRALPGIGTGVSGTRMSQQGDDRRGLRPGMRVWGLPLLPGSGAEGSARQGDSSATAGRAPVRCWFWAPSPTGRGGSRSALRTAGRSAASGPGPVSSVSVRFYCPSWSFLLTSPLCRAS